MSEKRNFLFPWMCRETGGFFFVEGWAAVKECPICGVIERDKEYDNNAFESGHCYRKFAESFFTDEQKR